jgi:hypothetical protein
MIDDERDLDDLFRQYRASCPDMDAGVNFMPHLWEKIDARRSFWVLFQRFARTGTAASLALFLILILLNATSEMHRAPMAPTYADALAADHTAESTYYAEAIRMLPVSDQSSAEIGRQDR